MNNGQLSMHAVLLPAHHVMFLAHAASKSEFSVSERIEMIRPVIADTHGENLPPDSEIQEAFSQLKLLVPPSRKGLFAADMMRALALVDLIWTKMGRPGYAPRVAS